MIGDFPSLTGNVATMSSCKCTEDGEVYFVQKEDFSEYLLKNPGIFVMICDQYVIL